MAGHSGHHGDPVSTHGMAIVGEEAVYLYHLPMFHRPHDYQVVLEARFTKAGSDVTADYVKDRRQTRTKLYTFEPSEQFALPELVSTDPAHPPRTSFPGRVVRGHFERGGTDLPQLKGVVAQVAHVIHFQKFNPSASQLPQLQYLLFGRGEDLFLAHLLTRPPDFDQIIAVKLFGRTFSEEELRRGIGVALFGRENSVDHRLKEGERVEADIQISRAGPSGPAGLQLQAGVEFYFETGDLAD